MSDYYPLDGELFDFGYLIKRWKANGIFCRLSVLEILTLIHDHELDEYISIFAWSSDLTIEDALRCTNDENALLRIVLHEGLFKPVKLHEALSRWRDFTNVELDLSYDYKGVHNNVFEITGSTRGNIDGFGFASFKLHSIDLMIYKDDVDALETGVFSRVNDAIDAGGSTFNRRVELLNDYINNINPNFPNEVTDWHDAWMVLQNKYGYEEFGADVNSSTSRRFFPNYGIKRTKGPIK